MVLIPFFGKRAKGNEQVGVAFMRDGIAVAHIVNSRSEGVTLTGCDFRSCDESHYAAALEEMVKSLELTGLPCVAVLESGAYQLLQIEAPDVPDSELKAALRWSIRDLIDFHIDDAILDIFDLPEDAQRGNAKMMNAVVARASLLKSHIQLVEAAGLDLQVLDIPELALRNVTARLPEDGAGMALVTLEREQGLILITRQKSLYLARNIEVSIGSGALESGEGGGFEFITAEQQQLFDAIILEIQRSQDYYERFYAQPPLQGVVVTTVGQEVPGMGSYISQNMGVDVHPLEFDKLVAGSERFDTTTLAHALLAIGAALRTQEGAA